MISIEDKIKAFLYLGVEYTRENDNLKILGKIIPTEEEITNALSNIKTPEDEITILKDRIQQLETQIQSLSAVKG